MNDIDVVRALAALAQARRLQLFRALVVAGAEGMTPGALSATCEVSPATLSFHLKELLHAGLATQERQGRHLVYRADFSRMNGVLGYLTDNCCQGAPCPLEAPAACA